MNMSILASRSQQMGLITGFLEKIEIPVSVGKVSQGSFLPGIEIVSGAIVFDPETLLYPGDLLHEAGHIALIPAEHRNKVSGNMAEQKFTGGGEEIAVLLWSYAASLFIGLSPEVVFHPHGYKGQSDWLLQQYADKTFIGLPLLQWMKLCKPGNEEDGFPVMQKWLRD
jgi:hypothetical protein